MRSRHFPRLCHSCQAPLARQEESCWRCGTQWAPAAEPRTRLRAIAGGTATQQGTATQGTDGPVAGIAVMAKTSRDAVAAVATETGNDAVAARAAVDTDRWANEGGAWGTPVYEGVAGET